MGPVCQGPVLPDCTDVYFTCIAVSTGFGFCSSPVVLPNSSNGRANSNRFQHHSNASSLSETQFLRGITRHLKCRRQGSWSGQLCRGD
ncbi:unnamed protein product [Triticum turgidum subsp. durum]|uniref:Uncharacterized protein n=1 Tax=Triticum turgidum subsp. durum TaxID=4567 RepID=A0A9R1PPK5_TRITD|nr:unnamed protein product [Triticum turgidum subsp. durum]